MKFIKEFSGVKAREIYPTAFAVGDECPPELEDAARTLGAVGNEQKPEETPVKRKGK